MYGSRKKVRDRPDCISYVDATCKVLLELVYFQQEILYGMVSWEQMVSCDNENYKCALIVRSLIKKSLFSLF